MQSLPTAEIVQARPRCRGPAVIQLPVQCPADPVHIPAPVLYARTDPLGLQDHGQINQRWEIRWHHKVLRHLCHEQRAGKWTALVVFDHVIGQVPMRLVSKVFDGL